MERCHPILHILSMVCMLYVNTTSAGKVGYFEGGAITWDVDATRPRVVNIQFRLHFRLDYDVYTHKQCSREAIAQKKPLITAGSFYINNGEHSTLAAYVCTSMDAKNNWATGVFNWQYTMPLDETTATINYESCCWLGAIKNNGESVSNGKGWNLVSRINTDHGDGTINTPPQSTSFPKYLLIEGCAYKLQIPNFDANGDDVKCRWTVESQQECNSDDRDICGEVFFDTNQREKVAFLKKKSCTLSFNKKLPAGIYAVPIMLEDFAPGNPDTPISKSPVQFLVEVLQNPGECRQPELDVPSDFCRTVVVGDTFRLELKATASAPQYVITDIKVLGLASEMKGPRLMQGSRYSATMKFSASTKDIGRHSFCVVAVEDDIYWSRQACFDLKVIGSEGARENLVALPSKSIPAANSNTAPDYLPMWIIRFSGQVKKATLPAYLRVSDREGSIVYQADTSGPDVLVEGDALSLLNAERTFLDFNTEYEISLDEGAVDSGDNCPVKSKAVQWTFTSKVGYPGSRESTPECAASDMTIFLPKMIIGTIDPGIMHLNDPQCTGRDHNSTHYSIATDYGRCGTTFARRGDEFTFTNVIYIPDVPYELGSEITRNPHKEILVNCHIPAAFVKTISFDPDVRILRETIEGRLTVDAPPVTSLNMYSDKTYTDAIGPWEYPVGIGFGTKMYLEASVTTGGGCPYSKCDVFLESCWATVSENPYDNPAHEFIREGCSVEDTVKIHSSKNSWKSRFSVLSFAFLGQRIMDTVYVHCNIVVCDSNDYQSVCSLGCRSSEVTKRNRPNTYDNDGAYWFVKRDVVGFVSAADE